MTRYSPPILSQHTLLSPLISTRLTIITSHQLFYPTSAYSLSLFHQNYLLLISDSRPPEIFPTLTTRHLLFITPICQSKTPLLLFYQPSERSKFTHPITSSLLHDPGPTSSVLPGTQLTDLPNPLLRRLTDFSLRTVVILLTCASFMP